MIGSALHLKCIRLKILAVLGSTALWCLHALHATCQVSKQQAKAKRCAPSEETNSDQQLYSMTRPGQSAAAAASAASDSARSKLAQLRCLEDCSRTVAMHII